MGEHEYNSLMKVQGIGVVRTLYETEKYTLPKNIKFDLPIDSYKVGILVAMEKLNTITLHPTNGIPLDTEKNFINRLTYGPLLLYMHSFDSNISNILRKLLNTIVEINNKGILWGDLKQENMGLDKDGKLRIFDFTDSSTISSMQKIPFDDSIDEYYTIVSNKHFDILAYGKLLYNIITQNFSFYPGRHYHDRMKNTGLIREQYLQVIDMIQDIDPISKNALQKCFLLNGESENLDNELSEAIKALYLMLDVVHDAPPVVFE